MKGPSDKNIQLETRPFAVRKKNLDQSQYLDIYEYDFISDPDEVRVSLREEIGLLSIPAVLQVGTRILVPQIGISADTDLLGLASGLLTIKGNLQAGSGGSVTTASDAFVSISHPSTSSGFSAGVTDGTNNRRFNFIMDHANDICIIQSTASTGASGISIRTGNTERMFIGVGSTFLVQGVYDSTSASAANVFVGSNGRLYRSTSSLKYKTEVEDLDPKLAGKVLELRPVWYRSRCEDDRKDWSWTGLIAEEVAKVEPRLVQFGKNKDGSLEPEGVDYSRLSVYLLKAFQSEVERNRKKEKEFENEIATLKGGLENLWQILHTKGLTEEKILEAPAEDGV